MWLQSAGKSLNSLCTANFTTINTDHTVERHILWFKRYNTNILSGQPATQSRYQKTLAGIRSGSLNH